MSISFLSRIPALKTDQLSVCEQAAEQRVRTYIGEMPVLENYTKSIAQQITLRQLISMSATPFDYAMIPLLLALFMVSLSHMLTFAGILAFESYHTQPDGFQGLWFSTFMAIIISQIGFFFMSEVGIIFFYNRYRVVDQDKPKHVSLNFWMSVFFAILTFVANIVSLLNNADTLLEVAMAVFVGALIPSATLLLGDRFAEISLEIVESKRRFSEEIKRAQDHYQADLSEWRAIDKDPTLFNLKDGKNSYRIYLARAIVDYYKRYIVTTSSFKDNNPAFSWSPDLEVNLAGREIAKLSVYSELDDVVNTFLSSVE